jgi:hypothetical protein
VKVILNLYEPTVGAPDIIKLTLMDLKAHIDANTILGGDFITSRSLIYRSTRQLPQVYQYIGQPDPKTNRET